MKTPLRSFFPIALLNLLAVLALSPAFLSRSEGSLRSGCVFFGDELPVSAPAQNAREYQEGPVKEIPGVRPPRADEVGPPPGVEMRGVTPLPGLPIDTSFDSVGWIPQGMGPGKDGDLNIVPDHPVSGCVTAIAPHPSNLDVIYIGTVNGGVWRTDNALDAKPRWKPLTDDQLSLSIGGLALDPSDPSGNTLVAGFGRRSSIGGLGGAHKGLIRTTDGGATWTKLGETALAGRSIYNLAVRGNIFLFAVPATDDGNERGLYRSTDGGTTFTKLTGLAGTGLPLASASHLAADPSDSTRFYVHLSGEGVYRSDNSGAIWVDVSAGMAAAPVEQLALAVAFDGTVFAAELAGTSRVYRSVNLGANWTPMDSVQANTSDIFNGFVADPSNSNLVYLSGLFTRCCFPYSGRVVRGDASKAAGTQWTAIASTGFTGTGTAPHTDSRVLAFTAGHRLIEGDDGGIYELPIANVGSEGTIVGDVGSEWRSLNGNLQNGEMHSMAYDPVARIFIGGAQDTGFSGQIKSGETPWNKTVNGDGGDAAVDLLTSPGQSIRYGSVQYFGGFFRNTYDANNNLISTAGPPTGGGDPPIQPGAPPPDGNGNMPFVTPIGMNAVGGGRIIISGNANLYESTDQGDTVTRIDSAPANNIAKIAYGGRLNGVDAPDVLFFGSGSTIRFRTTTGGAISNVPFPGGQVQGIALAPQDWRSAYVIGQTTIYSVFNVASFTNITGNLTGVGNLRTIDYLTLPSGNAIFVGADLGSYIMRVDQPGVWKTLGDNLPHAPVYDSHFDAAGQVLLVSTLGRGSWLYDFKPTKATGQYGETFQAFAENTVSFPARTGEFYSSLLPASAGLMDDNLRELQLTADGTGAARTAFRLPDLNPGRPVPAFSAKWNATIYGDSSGLADGFSFNFGQLGGITAAAFKDATYNHEDGFNAGLTVSVRTYSGNTPGYYVRVNGAVVSGGFVAKPSADWGDFNTARHFFEVDWRMDTGLTLRVDGVAIFTNLPTPGFLPAAGDRFVFGARTGAFDEEVSLDNIAIFTGGVLVPIPVEAPYHVSSENSAGGEVAANVFDGNVNTKWLTFDYTGFIGASLSSAKTVRLYTLTSADDFSKRDLATWDFQTGNDGVLWNQHGVQSGQFFANRFEQRAFVVANPEAASKFRVLISDNHEGAETQLAEFQPWEFIPVSAFFTVTNPNQDGEGSLRDRIADAAPFAGQSFITFAPALAGQTITLTNGPIVISSPAGVVIHALALSGGVTISGNNASRVIEVASDASCVLIGLTLTGGNVGTAEGGAINNAGRLTLQNCTLSGNSAGQGGAIFTATDGAFDTTFTNVRYCTFSGNNAALRGGAIHNDIGRTTLTHCTISGNSAPAGNGSGVASYGDSLTDTVVQDSIIGGNTNSDVDFVIGNSNNSFTSSGFNVIGSGNAIGDFNQSGDLVNTAPLLAPLDNYGGPTKTMALRPGSPARDASFGSFTVADQRNFPILFPADIGAYEAGTLTNYNAWIWELLPASATIAQHLTTSDFDGDGMNNFNEWLALTDPTSVLSVFRITQAARSGGNFDITFPTISGRTYTIEYSFNLIAWDPVATVPGTGGLRTVNIAVGGLDKIFFRIRTGP